MIRHVAPKPWAESAPSVVIEDRLEIPLAVGSFAAFRDWVRSKTFPDQGRIDYVVGCIEVDMSPEELFGHGVVKTEIIGILHAIIKQDRRGYLFADRTRVFCADADLSAEPDVVFVSHESIERETVQFVPKVSGEPGRFIEIDGPPDLVVEIVSDSSVIKDTQRLARAYFDAGVGEYWIVDARRPPVILKIHCRGSSAFVETGPDDHGYQPSRVLDRRFVLDYEIDARGYTRFDLRSVPIGEP